MFSFSLCKVCNHRLSTKLNVLDAQAAEPGVVRWAQAPPGARAPQLYTTGLFDKKAIAD